MGTDIQPPEETHDDTDGFITEEEEEIDNETDTSSELCEMPSMSTSESAGDHHAADDSSNTSSADVTMSTGMSITVCTFLYFSIHVYAILYIVTLVK